MCSLCGIGPVPSLCVVRKACQVGRKALTPPGGPVTHNTHAEYFIDPVCVMTYV